MDLIVNLDQSGVISPHVREICRAAPDTTFTRDTDLSATSHGMKVKFKPSQCHAISIIVEYRVVDLVSNLDVTGLAFYATPSLCHGLNHGVNRPA